MQADFLLDFDRLATGTGGTVHLMARFVTGAASHEIERRPLNLSLVIDRSGSMAGQKLDYTRQAAQFLVQNLGVDDILSIVLYNDKVETLLMPEKVQRKDAINQRIATIKASGTTNLSSGWLEGCNLVKQNHDTHYVNRVILMSDGLANRGVTDSAQLTSLAAQRFGEGVSTTTMGLGDDFNEDLLTEMAQAGGGAFYFIESAEVTPVIFKEELSGLLNVVGQNLTISIKPAAGIILKGQLNAYAMSSNGEATTFRLGDVFANELKLLMLEVAIPAVAQAGEREIATLRFEYDELLPDSTEHRVIEMPVSMTFGEKAAIVPHVEVQHSVLLLSAANARRVAIEAADRGDYETASRVLRLAADRIGDAANNDEELAEEKNALVRQASDMEMGADLYGQYSRKSMHTQAIYTMNSRHTATRSLRERELESEPNIRPKLLGQPEIKVEKRSGVSPTHVTWRDQTFELNQAILRVGRSDHNEIVLAVKGVSRFHCQIRRQGDQVIVEDLGSTNGTLVAGRPITSPYTLNAGDVVYVCDEKLYFHEAPGHTVQISIEEEGDD